MFSEETGRTPTRTWGLATPVCCRALTGVRPSNRTSISDRSKIFLLQRAEPPLELHLNSPIFLHGMVNSLLPNGQLRLSSTAGREGRPCIILYATQNAAPHRPSETPVLKVKSCKVVSIRLLNVAI